MVLKKSINKAVNKYLNSPEQYKEKEKEKNLCNFAQDIILLWHLKDKRVKYKQNE